MLLLYEVYEILAENNLNSNLSQLIKKETYSVTTDGNSTISAGTLNISTDRMLVKATGPSLVVSIGVNVSSSLYNFRVTDLSGRAKNNYSFELSLFFIEV